MSKKKNQKKAPSSGGSKNTIIFIMLAIAGFIFYGNSISNKYALDDTYVVTGNKFTKQGFEGIDNLLSTHFFAGYFEEGTEVFLAGGRYRPLSMVSFAIEYELFGENPHFSHFVNVILFILLCFVLFKVLMKLFPPPPRKAWYLSLPFIASLLFLAHPIHTEVVANIKGRDEILALLGSLGSLWFLLKYMESGRKITLLYAFLTFFLALMSKEIAAVFLVLIPLAMYYFNGRKFRELLVPMIPLVTAVLVFVLIRQSVLAGFKTVESTELMDNPFINTGLSEKFATIIFTLGMYLKLLFFPHPLTWDYYPFHISIKTWSDPVVILTLFAYISLGVLAIVGFFRKSIWSYIIVFYLVTLAPVSNIVFPVGTFMAERFLFSPSVAFCLFLAWVIAEFVPQRFQGFKPYILRLRSVNMGLFSIRTITRNDDWKDDFTLYSTDVEVSENGARSNQICGAWYTYMANLPENAALKMEYFEKAEHYLRQAIAIHPTYQQALFQMGNLMHDFRQNDDSTFYYYTRILKINPNEENVFKNINLILKNTQDTVFKNRIFTQLKAINPERPEVKELGASLGK